jgi:hypothetical protein
MVSATLLAAPVADANVCQWYDVFDGSTYPASTSNDSVDLHNNASFEEFPGYLANPIVVLDFWGNTWAPGDVNAIFNQLSTLFSDATFWGNLSQYGISTYGAGIVQVAYKNQTGFGNGTTLNRAQTEAALKQDFQNGMPYGFDATNNNSYINVVLLPPGVNYSGQGAGFGHHTSFQVTQGNPGFGTNSVYAVVTTLPNSGTKGPVNVSQAGGVTSHEVMEAATDPYGDGFYSNPPVNSNHPGNSTLEVGDLCNAQSVLLPSGVIAQRSWFQDLCSCGRFGTYQTWSGATISGTSLMGDVNGDGKADIIRLNLIRRYPLPPANEVMLSTGSSFGTQQDWVDGVLVGDHGFLAGDVDGDSKTDVVGLSDTGVVVLRSTGSSFTGETWAVTPFYGAPQTLLGDVDGDGRADLVAIGNGYVGVWHSLKAASCPAWASANGCFGNYETWFGDFRAPHGDLLADVDGDGHADVVGLFDGSVQVLTSTSGKAPYTLETWWNASFFGDHGTLLRDVDGDGKADLVAISDTSVTVLHGEGWQSFPAGPGFGLKAPRFDDQETWRASTFYGSYATNLVDVTGDGMADLVAFGSGYIGEITSSGL